MSERQHARHDAWERAPSGQLDDPWCDRSPRRGETLRGDALPDLSGRRILVVEDSYFIATDIASALTEAGARVLGPCPSEHAARDMLAQEAPTHAVVDLNLDEGGPRFNVAHLLRSRGVPFLFVTGYDFAALAPEFADVVCLQKPLSYVAVIHAICGL